LERIHTERGDSTGAERFGELRRRFQRAAGLSDADLLASHPAAADDGDAEVSVEQEALADSEHPPHIVSASPASSNVQEVDLSDEWSAMLKEAAPSPPTAGRVPPPPPPVADESPAE